MMGEARRTKRPKRGGERQVDGHTPIDTELEHLPAELRWREWMNRVEAVIFASAQPVPRDVLAQIVGKDCNLDLIIDDIRDELRGRPYELVAVAGGFQHRTRSGYADVIRMATGQGTANGQGARSLTQSESLVLTAIAYFQPITRGELSTFFGKEVSRDLIAVFRSEDLIAAGPRSPRPGAPYTYVTTKTFLSVFGLATLRDLPDFEALEDAGLLSKDSLLAGDIPTGLIGGAEEEEDTESEENEKDEFFEDDPLIIRAADAWKG